MLIRCFVILALLVSFEAFANERKKRTTPAQWGVVGIDGATVYQSPDFDSKVLIRLESGFKAVISQKALPGHEGVGLFYRIKFAERRFGYVVDIEMIPQFQIDKKKETVEKNPTYEQVENLRERVESGQAPISESRYLGLGISRLNFQDKFQGKSHRSDLMLYGLRWSGPGILFDGPPLDVNIAFTPSSPSYFKSATGSSASGMMVLLDMLFRVAFLERRQFATEGGLGLAVNHSRYTVKQAQADLVEQKTRVGLVADLGAAVRHKKLIARLSAKYYYTGHLYPALLFSLQYEY